MTTWYLMILTLAGETHLYELGREEQAVMLPDFEARRAAAMVELGVPEEWLGTGWDVSLVDDPHPSLLARAIVHPLPADPPEEG